MRHAAVVDIEIWVEDRLALSAEEGGLRLDPQARLLLPGISLQPRRQIVHDLGKLIGDIVLLARILRQIEQFGASRQQRDLDQLPIAPRNGSTLIR